MHYLINYSCHYYSLFHRCKVLCTLVPLSSICIHLNTHFCYWILWIPYMIQDFSVMLSSLIFFYEGFLSWTLTTHRPAGEWKGTSFILIYHFHLLMNMQTFNCNFACKMTISNHTACIYQTAAWWDLPPY